METYMEFMKRIYSFERPEFGIDKQHFRPSDSVIQKVNGDNNFAPYYGDTVVYDLSLDVKDKVSKMIDKLYAEVSECFCKKLDVSTLHMTLHDLTSSPSKEQIEKRINQNYNRLLYMLNYKYKFVYQRIRMRTNNIINMVNTSVVLALYPVDEIEYSKLMYFYNALDEIVELPYPFTPHITLAYYNRNGFGEKSAEKLCKLVYKLNSSNFEMVLNTQDLVYQRFQNMNSYQTFLKFSS